MSFFVFLFGIIQEIAEASIRLVWRGSIPEIHGRGLLVQRGSNAARVSQRVARSAPDDKLRYAAPLSLRIPDVAFAHPGYANATFLTACRTGLVPWPRATGRGRGRRCGWFARDRGSRAGANTSDAWRCAPR